MSVKKIFAAAQSLALLFTVCAGDVTARGGESAAQRHTARRKAARVRRGSRAGGKKMISGAKESRVAAGTWGGAHVRLDVREGGGALEFDCAHGEISEPFATDAGGRFDLSGTYTRESGGPIRIDHPPTARPARYSGRVEGRTMTLSVKLADDAQTLDAFTLTRDSEGRIWKCR